MDIVILIILYNAINSVRVHSSRALIVLAHSWGKPGASCTCPAWADAREHGVSSQRFTEALHVLKVGVMCERVKTGWVGGEARSTASSQHIDKIKKE